MLVNDRREYADENQHKIGTLGCRLSPMLCGQRLNKRKRSASVVDFQPTRTIPAWGGILNE